MSVLYFVFSFGWATECLQATLLAFAAVGSSSRKPETESAARASYGAALQALEAEFGPLHTWSASNVGHLMQRAGLEDVTVQALGQRGIDGQRILELDCTADSDSDPELQARVQELRTEIGPDAAAKLSQLASVIKATISPPGLMDFWEFRRQNYRLVSIGLPLLMNAPRTAMLAMSWFTPGLEQHIANEHGSPVSSLAAPSATGSFVSSIRGVALWLLAPQWRAWGMLRVFTDTNPFLMYMLGLTLLFSFAGEMFLLWQTATAVRALLLKPSAGSAMSSDPLKMQTAIQVAVGKHVAGLLSGISKPLAAAIGGYIFWRFTPGFIISINMFVLLAHALGTAVVTLLGGTFAAAAVVLVGMLALTGAKTPSKAKGDAQSPGKLQRDDGAAFSLEDASGGAFAPHVAAADVQPAAHYTDHHHVHSAHQGSPVGIRHHDDASWQAISPLSHGNDGRSRSRSPVHARMGTGRTAAAEAAVVDGVGDDSDSGVKKEV